MDPVGFKDDTVKIVDTEASRIEGKNGKSHNDGRAALFDSVKKALFLMMLPRDGRPERK